MTATDHQPKPQATAQLPLPADIWQRVIAFLGSKHSGQVILDVHQGQIKAARITEVVRTNEEAA